MIRRKTLTICPPIALPVLFFAVVILVGALLLRSPLSHTLPVSWTDALFTATSATCVTGLTVLDVGSRFNRFGQTVLIALIQLGGLGIMTFTGLAFYLWRQRVSITDQIAVGQSLLHDPRFHLGTFLKRIVTWTLLIEILGAILLHLLAPEKFQPFSALFHAVSAFCNAGFSLRADNLLALRDDWGVNLVIMLLIILGGIGFSVLHSLRDFLVAKSRRPRPGPGPGPRLDWYTRVVLRSSLFLILSGWTAIYLAEVAGFQARGLGINGLLAALFQSVTCRTAGFNTLDIGKMTNVSLLVMVILMFIGGAPGSCAGGIKVTTFRVLSGFALAQVRGQQQTVIGRYAVDRQAVHKALSLLVFATSIVFFATLALNITEGGDIPHPEARGLFLESLFETVSAFGTVGLSTGLTSKLSLAGRYIIILLMFVGRLGPLLFLASLQSLHQERFYTLPEENLLIG